MKQISTAGDVPESRHEKSRRPFCGYRVDHCPQYLFADERESLEENLIVQQALWDAIRFLIVHDSGVSAELRIGANPYNQSLSVQLLFTRHGGEGMPGGDGPTGSLPVATLDRMLPEDYGWSKLGFDELRESAVGETSPDGWRVARLIRRTEFCDLPTAFPWDFAQHDESISAVAGAEHSAREAVPLLGKRMMPMMGVPVRDQMIVQPLCLPLAGTVQEVSADRQRLCRELQRSAPAVLSITLHPVSPTGLRNDRITATHFRRCLEACTAPRHGALIAALADEGIADPGTLRGIYDRYWLPPQHLCFVTVRVAASSDGDALAVVHSLAARLGGMRRFDVLPPTRSIADLDTFSDPSVDLPLYCDQSNQQPATLLERRLAENGVEPNPLFTSFLQRLPHLYKLDEARHLLRIPFATGRGLPGIPTRMVAPFYPTALSDVALADPPPTGRIRLGLISETAIEPSADPVAREAASSGAAVPHSPPTLERWHTLDVKDLASHVAIFGRIGMGKSTLTRFFLREIDRMDVPFLVIEPVGAEYYEKLKPQMGRLRRWCFEGTSVGKPHAEYLRFDPMRLQHGVTVMNHVSLLRTCFEAAFPMADVQSMVLHSGLYAYYQWPTEQGGCGLRKFDRGGPERHRVDGRTGSVWPSFATFHPFFVDRYLPHVMKTIGGGESRRNAEFVFEWQQMFRRRFENVAAGPLGTAFERADEMYRKDRRVYDTFPALIKHPTVIELDGIPDNEQKALVMAMLLSFLYERRIADAKLRAEAGLPSQEDTLRHVLLIEEAHRLLSRETVRTGSADTVGESASRRTVTLFAEMFAEMRKHNQGLMVVEQIPTKITADVVKNSNLVLMMRVPAKEDRDFLGDTMNLNELQRNFVARLRTGQFVAFEEQLDQPLLMHLPDPATLEKACF